MQLFLSNVRYVGDALFADLPFGSIHGEQTSSANTQKCNERMLVQASKRVVVEGVLVKKIAEHPKEF